MGWQCAIITLVTNESQHGKAFMNNWPKKRRKRPQCVDGE